MFGWLRRRRMRKQQERVDLSTPVMTAPIPVVPARYDPVYGRLPSPAAVVRAAQARPGATPHPSPEAQPAADEHPIGGQRQEATPAQAAEVVPEPAAETPSPDGFIRFRNGYPHVEIATTGGGFLVVEPDNPLFLDFCRWGEAWAQPGNQGPPMRMRPENMRPNGLQGPTRGRVRRASVQ
jgi:hypothetical protein